MGFFFLYKLFIRKNIMENNILNEELNQMKYLFGYKPGKVISEQTTPTPSPTPTKTQGPGEVIVKAWDGKDRTIKFPFIKNQEMFDKFTNTQPRDVQRVFLGEDPAKIAQEATATSAQTYNKIFERTGNADEARRMATQDYLNILRMGSLEAQIITYLLTNLASSGVKIEDYLQRIGKDQLIPEFNKVVEFKTSDGKKGWDNYFIVDAYGVDKWEEFKEKLIPFVRQKIQSAGGNPDEPMKVTQTPTSPTTPTTKPS